MLSSCTGISDGLKESKLGVTSSSLSASPDNRFDILFPSYSQSMFSGLLDGDLLDEELNALLNFNNEVSAASTNTAAEGSVNDSMQHPGLLMACTAAALDGNPVVGEPYFFCDPSGPNVTVEESHGNLPVMRTFSTEGMTGALTEKATSEPPKPTISPPGQMRMLSVPEKVSCITKNMLQKAKRISFQSSCGPLAIIEPKFEMMAQKAQTQDTYNSNCTVVDTETLPLLLPRPPETVSSENSSSSCTGSASMSNESVSIVDALIQTLSNDKKQNLDAPLSAPMAVDGVLSSASSLSISPSNASNQNANNGTHEVVRSAVEYSAIPDPLAHTRPTVATVDDSLSPPTANTAPMQMSDLVAFFGEAGHEPNNGSSASVASTMDSVQSNPDVATSDAKLHKGGRRQICTELQEIPKEMRKRTRGLSSDERNELSKNRNRIHARNTRLRKKAYVDDLKKSVMDLVNERDAAEAMQVRQAKILKQNRDVRFMVMQHYLKLHATAEESPAQRWETLLTDNIVVTLPSINMGVATTTATGVDNVISYSKSFSLYVKESCGDLGLAISFDCDRKSFLMDGATAVLEVSMKVFSPLEPERAVLSFVGCLRSTFCVQTNKIQSSRLLLDLGGLTSKQGPA